MAKWAAVRTGALLSPWPHRGARSSAGAQSRPPAGTSLPILPQKSPPNPRLHRAVGPATPGSPRFVSGARLLGNACAGRGMSSAPWLRSLDPIPGNVTGNSEWAGPAPERGALGGQRTPGVPGHTGTQRRAGRSLPPLPGDAPEGLSPPRRAETFPAPSPGQVRAVDFSSLPLAAPSRSPRGCSPKPRCLPGAPVGTAQEVRAGRGGRRGGEAPRRPPGTGFGEHSKGGEEWGRAPCGCCAGNGVEVFGVPWGDGSLHPTFCAPGHILPWCSVSPRG